MDITQKFHYIMSKSTDMSDRKEKAPTTLISISLSLTIMASMFFLFLLFSLIVASAFGIDSFTYGNEFFIQCGVFTVVIMEAEYFNRLFRYQVSEVRRFLSLYSVSVKRIVLGGAAACGLTFPLSELDNVLRYLIPPSEHEIQTMISAYNPPDSLEKIFVILSLIVVAPIGEELIFRGAVMSWLRESSGWRTALILSSILFALSHLFLPRTIILIIPVGFLLGYLLLRTGSIFVSIASHASFNGFPLIAYWSGWKLSGYNNPGGSFSHIPFVFWFGGLVVFVASIILLERNTGTGGETRRSRSK